MNQEAQPIVNRVIPLKITTKSKSNLQAPTKNHDSGTEVSLSLTPSSSQLFEQQIKKLQEENGNLTKVLQVKCELLHDLKEDLRRRESDRMYCMIFELFQRIKRHVNKDKTSDLDAKTAEYFENEKQMVKWVQDITNGPELKSLEIFRNNYAHQVCDDTKLLRKWRSKLMLEYNGEAKDSVSIQILRGIVRFMNVMPRSFQNLLSREGRKSNFKKKTNKEDNDGGKVDGTNLLILSKIPQEQSGKSEVLNEVVNSIEKKSTTIGESATKTTPVLSENSISSSNMQSTILANTNESLNPNSKKRKQQPNQQVAKSQDNDRKRMEDMQNKQQQKKQKQEQHQQEHQRYLQKLKARQEKESLQKGTIQ